MIWKVKVKVGEGRGEGEGEFREMVEAQRRTGFKFSPRSALNLDPPHHVLLDDDEPEPEPMFNPSLALPSLHLLTFGNWKLHVIEMDLQASASVAIIFSFIFFPTLGVRSVASSFTISPNFCFLSTENPSFPIFSAGQVTPISSLSIHMAEAKNNFGKETDRYLCWKNTCVDIGTYFIISGDVVVLILILRNQYTPSLERSRIPSVVDRAAKPWKLHNVTEMGILLFIGVVVYNDVY